VCLCLVLRLLLGFSCCCFVVGYDYVVMSAIDQMRGLVADDLVELLSCLLIWWGRCGTPEDNEGW